MLEKNLISVIIPIYNVEKYISKCLDSVINQTYKKIEIICVDDGSPDNSIKILEEYEKKDSRVKIIRQENRGLSGARNTGIKNSKGEYIFFLDSDDWLPSNSLELLYKDILLNKSDISVGNLIKVYPKKNKEIGLKKLKKNNYSLRNYLEYSINKRNFTANVVNKLYKTKIIVENEILFKEKILYEDFLFTIQYFIYCKRISVIKEKVYYYFLERENSIVNTVSMRDLETFLNVIEIEKFLIKNNQKEILNSKYFQNYIFEWLLSATVSKLFKNGNVSSIEKMYYLIKDNFIFKKYYNLYQKNKIISIKKLFSFIFYTNKNIFLKIIKIKSKALKMKGKNSNENIIFNK